MYRNREEAGKQLAKSLRHFKSSGTVVLALPRGGIVTGAEVAKELDAPLGLVLVKKIGHPMSAEYAIGALAEDTKPVYNKTETANIDNSWLKHAEDEARALIRKRKNLYYGDKITPTDVSGKIVILVDDGMATGLTMRAAVQAMRDKHAARIIVAVPVASEESFDALEIMADEIVVLEDPEKFFGAVGSHYIEFEQVDDDEVKRLLRQGHEGGSYD